MASEIIVNIGRYAIAHEPDVLVCLGLGSCVGVAVYDHQKKKGGLAHIMLPDSKIRPEKSEGFNLNKFADVSIPSMVNMMKNEGCETINLVAKIAGGAQMFPGILDEETMDIGRKNVDAAMEELEKLGINIAATEIGGIIGRTVVFDTSTGKLTIKTKDSTKEI